ncbi:MAG: hypothetical protein K6G16_08140 [Lachnospiraceae bacterium]|nr:hypothetical protein [Lachnospiraceae bacterium]
MTFSSFVHDKTGKRIVRVSFERAGAKGRTDRAEGVVPGGVIDKNDGFSAEETKQLSEYLVANENDILARAREISNPMRWMS